MADHCLADWKVVLFWGGSGQYIICLVAESKQEGDQMIQADLHRDKKEKAMYNKEELCTKITEIYPDIGECGIDVNVDYDDDKKVWVVDLIKDSHELKHYLDLPEADECMDGHQCVSLGLEIAQLKKNVEGKQF
jgi:hypothetical protein